MSGRFWSALLDIVGGTAFLVLALWGPKEHGERIVAAILYAGICVSGAVRSTR